jgi:putative peptidoglycan lipid II flippase
MALFLALPAAGGLAVLAAPIMVVLFRHGALSEEAALKSAGALALYALGLPAFVTVKTLQPGFFARGDTATPVRVGVAIVGVNLVLNLVSIRFIGLYGPPLATSLSASLNVLWLGVLLIRRGLWRPAKALWSDLGRIALATFVMAGLTGLLAYLWPAPREAVPAAFRLFALIGAGVGLYGGLALWLGLFGLVSEAVRRRILRKA